MAALMGLMPERLGAGPMPAEGIKVVGHPHGIRRGWFAWPMNFDPAWLLECDGFQAKDKVA